MNLTIGSTFPTTWKRIKTQHLVAICGAALAISAAVGVGAWQASELGGGSGQSIARSVPQPFAAPTHVYYIVDSPERAQAVMAVEQQAFAAAVYSGQPSHTFEVIDASTLDVEAGLTQLMGAGVASQGRIQVVDLRTN